MFGLFLMNGYESIMIKRTFFICLLTIAAFISFSGTRTIYRNDSQAISARALLLDEQDKKRRFVGPLEFLGAWELKSDNQNFGGISEIKLLSDGRFLGISDAGTLIGFGLSNDAHIDRPFIAPIPYAYQTNYKDRDAEGMTYDPATNQIWISYEGNHAIRRFSTSMASSTGIARPAAMQKWSSNSGAEAMVRLSDGRFILFSEGYDRPDGSYDALLFSGDPVEPGSKYIAFGYRPPVGYKPTSAALLPDGDILILNRRISLPYGFSAKFVKINPDMIQAEQSISGDLIATLGPPVLTDNMEGLAINEENGRTILWLISDNNFFILQRTLLMKFALNEHNKKPEADVPAPGFDSL